MSLLEGELPDWVHRRAREGCRVASGVIVRRHSGFAVTVCNRLAAKIHLVPREDMDAFAMEGLFRASLKHDPSRGTKFCTTAEKWVAMSVRRGASAHRRWFSEPIAFMEGGKKYLEKHKGKSFVAPLVAHMERNGFGPAMGKATMAKLMYEAVDREREVVEARIDCRWLPWGVLSPRERASLVDHYIDGLGFKEIADRDGTTRTVPCQNVGRGEVKLKKAIDKRRRVRRCG